MPRSIAHVRYAEIDAETRASMAERESEVTFDPSYFVQGTGLGPWAGLDFLDAISRIRGELGAPHLSYLPSLAERGYAATTLARSICCLEGLEGDGASFGWRLVNGFSREGEKARSLFTSDINALADTAGKESSAGNAFKLQLQGPLSLASSLYLPHGERAISDYGAVRDIRDSLIAGIGDWLRLLSEAVPSERLVIQFNEPTLREIFAGTIRTASGFRTYRALAPHILEESYQLLASEIKKYNAKITVASDSFDHLKKLDSIVSASAFSGENFEEKDWEKVATLIEAGQQVWLGIVPVDHYAPVSQRAQRIWKAWRTIGLPASALTQLTLTESEDLSSVSPTQATSVLNYLTELSHALSEIAQDN